MRAKKTLQVQVLHVAAWTLRTGDLFPGKQATAGFHGNECVYDGDVFVLWKQKVIRPDETRWSTSLSAIGEDCNPNTQRWEVYSPKDDGESQKTKTLSTDLSGNLLNHVSDFLFRTRLRGGGRWPAKASHHQRPLNQSRHQCLMAARYRQYKMF